MNDAKRGTKDGFDHALRTMLELKKTKCKNIGFSVIISPDNFKDLIHLYELSSYLNVELGNSVVHNSWYFHKEDNKITSIEALAAHEQFLLALLTSKRNGLKNKLKDYGRAYFNKSIHQRLRGDAPGYRPQCGALNDFFFIDPYGNVSPCNGSKEEWIIGNIKEKSFEEIMNSEDAKKLRQNILNCDRNCTFIVTERHDMSRRPWVPIKWILTNKIRIITGKGIQIT
jgi:MoaA/NifB/PqqE/SkfB family radical SAM enzyme